MINELRLNLQAPAERFGHRFGWRRAGKGRRRFDPRLSTAFAERRHDFPQAPIGIPGGRVFARGQTMEQGAMR